MIVAGKVGAKVGLGSKVGTIVDWSEGWDEMTEMYGSGALVVWEGEEARGPQWHFAYELFPITK